MILYIFKKLQKNFGFIQVQTGRAGKSNWGFIGLFVHQKHVTTNPADRLWKAKEQMYKQNVLKHLSSATLSFLCQASEESRDSWREHGMLSDSRTPG